MTNPMYTWYGLTNIYNSMLLTNQMYYGNNATMFLEASAHFGISDYELEAVIRVCDYLHANFLFRGPLAKH